MMKRHLMLRMVGALALSLASGAVTADVAAGRRAIDRSDYAAALKELLAPAERGDPEAQFQLGRMYAFGWGVKVDKARADHLFRESAARGHPRARLLLLKSCERDSTQELVRAANEALRTASAADVLRDGRKLCSKSATVLEELLKANADDLVARYRLLGYYYHSAAGEIGPAKAVAGRRPHVLWLIENHPESDVADAAEVQIAPTSGALADPAGHAAGSRLWLRHLDSPSASAIVYARAARYHQVSDKPRAEQILLAGRQRFPEGASEFNAHLGYLYAMATLGIARLNHTGIPVAGSDEERRSEFAVHARKMLQQSNDAALIGVGGKILSQYGTMMMALGATTTGEFHLAEQLLLRAEKLQPENPFWPGMIGEHLRMVARIGPRAGADRTTLKRALAYMEKSLAATTDPEWRLDRLRETAKLAYLAGNLASAERHAGELLALVKPHPGDEKYGQAWHDGHVIMGRIALQRKAPDVAREHLYKAGMTAGGGSLSSFGPDMGLAKELLEHGDSRAVVEYLELCRKFWTSPHAPIDRWISEIESGQRPDFRPNIHD